MLADSLGRGLIIWPIAQKLFQSVMLQQRPRWTGGRMIGVGSMRHAGTRPTLPWDDADRPPAINFGRYYSAPIAWSAVSRNFALCALNIRRENLSEIEDPHKAVQFGNSMQMPSVVHALKPMPTEVFGITGITKDSAGTPLVGATASLFRLDYDSGNNKLYIHIGSTVSNASGSYSFKVNKVNTYRVVADNGTVAGTTLDTLTGTNGG